MDSRSEPLRVAVCLGTGCYLRGAYDVIKEFNELAEEHDIADFLELKGTFCLEKCDNGISVDINGEIVTGVTPENANKIFMTKIFPLINNNCN